LGLLDQTAEPDLTKKAGMFIRVSNADWQPKENIQDYKETFRLKRSIGCIGSRRTIESLQNDPGVDYVEGSPQSSSWEFSAPTSLSKKPSKSANFLKVTNAEKIHAKEEPEKGNEAIVAIIDTNINILHPTFLGEGETTRFLGILDLTDLDHPIEYTQDEINSYISSFASKKSTKDIPQVLIDDCSMSSNPSNCRQGHGTHVASIAAGKAVGNFSGGVAPEAKIVVVIIPLSSDRFHDAYGKGIEYIQRIASKIPVVINISQGFNIGSHDGLYYTEWLFEDSLLEHGSEVGVAVVKSAGNERLSERHVKINLSNGTTISPITWNCIEDTRSNLAIEVWFDSAYELEFYLENPSGERSSVIRSNKTISETFPVSGNSYNISYRKTDLRNGASLVSIKLISGIVDYIQGEEWKLHINILNRKIKTESKDLHAWIDDTGSSRAIIFNAMTYLNQEVTVTTPGNASHIITVGSIRNLSENLTIDSHELSSIGPTRRGGTKPDLVAPGFNIFAACAGNHERPCPKSGTSMAAPQVTGAIALAYSAINKRISDDPSFPQPNATQIIKALTSSCYQPDGYSVDNFHGFGVLDIQHFFSWLGLT
jgi:endonuclease G